MKITCPNCESSFQLANGSLGSTGRKVRCTKCGTVWHAMPVSDVPDDFPPPGPTVGGRSRPAFEEPSVDEWKSAIADDPEPPVRETFDPDVPDDEFPASAARKADDDVDMEGDSNVVPFRGVEAAPEPEPEAAGQPAAETLPSTIDAQPAGFDAPKREKRAGPQKKKKGRSKGGFDLSTLSESALVSSATGIIVMIVVAMFFGRVELVKLFPDFAGLYEAMGIPVNLRGLEFENIRTYREVDGATPVLVVEGEITNITEDEQPVLPLRFGLISASGREVYAWTMDPPKTTLDAGNRMSFKSRLPAPPEAATDVQVRFSERRGP